MVHCPEPDGLIHGLGIHGQYLFVGHKITINIFIGSG